MRPSSPTSPALLTADEADVWLRGTSGDTGDANSPASKVRRLVRAIASGSAVVVPALPTCEHEWYVDTAGITLDLLVCRRCNKYEERKKPALPDGEREAFEAWWKREAANTEHHRWDYDKAEFWWVWQARAALEGKP